MKYKVGIYCGEHLENFSSWRRYWKWKRNSYNSWYGPFRILHKSRAFSIGPIIFYKE